MFMILTTKMTKTNCAKQLLTMYLYLRFDISLMTVVNIIPCLYQQIYTVI